jgi:hypothetical protein
MILARQPGRIMLLVLSVTAGLVATASPSLPQATALRLESVPVEVSRPAIPSAGPMTPDSMEPSAAGRMKGNPLWSVPLGTLTATRERPLFSPSRRPPPAPVLVSAPVAAPPPPPPPPAPERPNLSLIGTVRGETGGIAVFLDPTTQATVRLHTGQSHRGWILHSVDRRAAELHKGDRTETIGLWAPVAQQTAALPAPVAQQLPALPPGTAQTPGSPRPSLAQRQLPPGAMPSPPPPPPPLRAPRQPRRSR